MLLKEASRTRLEFISSITFDFKTRVSTQQKFFKTRFAMNQPCLQNKICFQYEGWISAPNKKKQTNKTNNITRKKIKIILTTVHPLSKWGARARCCRVLT